MANTESASGSNEPAVYSVDPLDSVDTVVIGAGIAGLTAARLLHRAGRSAVVLEARYRIGGRLLSEHYEGGDRVDLGATWFWPGESRVERLIAELEISVFPQYLSGDAVFHQPASTSSVAGAARIDGNPLDVPSGRFVQGAASLAEAVAADLPRDWLRLGTEVNLVRAEGRRLVVRTATSIFDADHVIVATPPALAAACIEFDPPLPDRLAGLAALTPVWMGSTIKVVVRYETPFWREKGLSGSGISHIGPLRELHDMSGPDGKPAAIFGFVPGLTAEDPTPTPAEIEAQLIEMFGPEAAAPQQILVRDWRGEVWTSPPGVEKLSAYQAFGHQLYQSPTMGGRLHWSSTETSTVNPGHIEGALAAAERAVAAITADGATTASQKEHQEG